MLAIASVLAVVPGLGATPVRAAPLDEGVTYWNVFNVEGESSAPAQLVTYSTLDDMLNDVNRTGVHTPGGVFSRNIVGSGSDGTTYWNVFNVEGESSAPAQLVTYSTLDDMLNDVNRTGVHTPGGVFSRNLVGSGASPAPTAPDDPLVCNGLAATIVGTEGDDTLVGTDGPDVIVGLGGNDRIAGLGGDDVICGGDGNDWISGGDGDDRLFGGAGDDDLAGGAGDDLLRGEGGDDRLAGGDGTDVCTGGPGVDSVAGCEA
ncbi:MAG TPA: calcium-binding protein [Acidimicrobiales bacterium]|nr:calcium-binding protein [Acidimicrobiales bacterium]